MSQEVTILILVIAGVIVFFLVRKWSELPAPKLPLSGPATVERGPQVEGGTDLVLITHPVIRRAAKRVLARGGEAAKYIVRDGERIYFSFDRMEDPVQRQRALDLIKGIQAGQDVDIGELMQLVRRMFNE